MFEQIILTGLGLLFGGLFLAPVKAPKGGRHS